jgi:fumarylpyruvate hydrolase
MTVLPVIAVPTIAMAESDARFPVRRIFCVGQNYAEHAREMGGDPDRAPPFFFTKPADAVVPSGSRLVFPTRTEELHHEVELVVALGEELVIFGCAVGLDLTRRDLQAVAKKAGRPWDMAKGFDRSAPIGPLTLGPPPADAAITLSIDGGIRQRGRLSDMIWSVDEIIAELGTYVELRPGDLIFTGTPAGVGPIRRGETVRGTIEGLAPVEVGFES